MITGDQPTMSKREEPAEAAAGPPPRLGDHSSCMPEPLLPLADVRIKVKGGVVLPAHASALVLNCGVLARSSELFAGATSNAPVAQRFGVSSICVPIIQYYNTLSTKIRR